MIDDALVDDAIAHLRGGVTLATFCLSKGIQDQLFDLRKLMIEKMGGTEFKLMIRYAANRDPEYPTARQMFLDLVKSTKDAAKTMIKEKQVYVSEDARMSRLATCAGCDSLDVEKNRCISCGCYVNIKSRLVGFKCPKGRWKE